MRTYSLLITFVYCFTVPIHAEIITDGTLGNQVHLSGPHFQIEAKLGQQHGGHLFHSFQEFNLQSHESATFSGPSSVQNIISRVTGGNPSNIDGLIRSTIPNANFYFLNPYGILFGPNAQLDVTGDFHVSTADTLQLQAGGRFNARQPDHSLLTTAPIEAFGFLTDSPAQLLVENSQLSTVEGKTFSVIVGDLSIQGGQLSAPQGRFNLASTAQKGEINITDSAMLPFEKQGTIKISNQAHLNVDGEGSGAIIVRGGQLIVENALLQAHTLGAQNGRGITLNLAKSIEINGKSSKITGSTLGEGTAGTITVTTPRLTLNQGVLLSNSLGQGIAGDIYLDTAQIVVYEGGKILSESYDKGPAGNLVIHAKESLSIIDKRTFPKRETAENISHISSATMKEGSGGSIQVKTSQLTVDGSSIISNSHSQGNAGKIAIEADSVRINNGGLISATVLSRSSGRGGNISFKVKDTIHVSGFRRGFTVTTTDVFENMQSAIAAITFGSGPAGHIELSAKNLIIENQSSMGTATGGVGDAGNLTVEVDDLSLNTGGIITNSSGGIVGGKLYLGTGASGTAKITARNSIVAIGRGYFNPSGILSNTLVSGRGGNIEIKTERLHLAEGAEISANSLGTGQSGELDIRANTLEIFNGGKVTTSAQHAAGGDIHLTSAQQIYLRNGEITTSVAGGIKDGGDITINCPTFVVLNQGQIKAQADAGNGGNIRIIAEQFIATPDSLISASSQKGLSGEIFISSPENNIGSNLIVLGAESLKVDHIKTLCNKQRRSDKPSRFMVTPLAGNPLSPQDDWQGSFIK